MGYYIQTPSNFDKAKQLRDIYNAELIGKPLSFSEIPEGKALIVVVQNGLFDAAGFAFNESEFEAFTDPSDYRKKTYLLMDRKLVEKLTGFVSEGCGYSGDL